VSQPSSGGPTPPGIVSPDGAYLWNGTQWIPHGPGALSSDRTHTWNGAQWVPNPVQWAAPPPKQGHGLRNVGIGALGCLVLLITIPIVGAFGSGLFGLTPSSHNTSQNGSTLASPRSTASAATAAGCSPQPCASGYSLTVHISGLNRNEPLGFFKPEAGNHLVLMQMTMHNDGGQDAKSINPFDFKLRDTAGVAHSVTFSDAPGCDLWSGVELAPGATYGPKPLCFEASGDPTGSLTLLWSPGLFSATQEIRL
jgi:uncharacterized protein DUF4352